MFTCFSIRLIQGLDLFKDLKSTIRFRGRSEYAEDESGDGCTLVQDFFSAVGQCVQICIRLLGTSNIFSDGQQSRNDYNSCLILENDNDIFSFDVPNFNVNFSSSPSFGLPYPNYQGIGNIAFLELETLTSGLFKLWCSLGKVQLSGEWFGRLEVSLVDIWGPYIKSMSSGQGQK